MDALLAWYKQIQEHITESGLFNLSEYKDETGIKPFEKFTNITRSKENIKAFSYSDFKHGDELLILSQDLMYIIAIIELLLPNINDAVKERGTYNQTTEDHLYLRYAGFGVQVIYSYWDRIGDLLDLFFDSGQTGDIYVGRVLNNFPTGYKSGTYDQLYHLYKNDVEPVLTHRHGVVHTFTLKSKYFWDTMENSSNAEELKALQHEKAGYPKLFRHQLELFYKGFSLALKLISELPDKSTEMTVGSN